MGHGVFFSGWLQLYDGWLRRLNLELLVEYLPTNLGRRCLRTTEHNILSHFRFLRLMSYLFSYTSGISPFLTYHMNQRRHAGCLCIFGLGPPAFLDGNGDREASR